MEDEVLKNLMGEVEVEGEEVVEEPTEVPEPEKPEIQVDKPPKETREEEPVKEKERPFHKNPKFIRLQQERDEAIRQREEDRKLYAELNAKIDRFGSPQTPSQTAVPDNLKHIFGDDVESYKALTSHLVESYRSVSREEAMALKKQDEERVRLEQETQQKLIKEAEAVLADLSDRTGTDFSDTKSDARNQLLSICETYGINDFDKAYELYQKLYPPDGSTEERKSVAGNTSSKTIASPSKGEEVMTSAKLKKIRLNSFFS
jgi:hypothetical protein